jgi:hypothetical protein
MISMNAQRGECRPKKMIDQRVFKTSCPKKIPSASLTPFAFKPFFQIRKADMPMSTKSVVQTGPNTHDGGLRAGFVSTAYQLSIDGVVNIEPIIPASSDTTIAMISFRVLDMGVL